MTLLTQVSAEKAFLSLGLILMGVTAMILNNGIISISEGVRILRYMTYLAACLACSSVLLVTGAHAGEVPYSLRTPSLSVKSPDSVVLISITRAGDRLVAVGEHGVIIYSDDNGKSWHQGAVPVDVTLTAIGFANPRDGWAVGHYGVILHSSDGGATWDKQLDGIEANRLTLAAAKAAAADHDPSPGAPLAVRRATLFMAAGPDKPFLSVLPVGSNGDDALIFGAYRMTMRTTNAGDTWSDWSLHIGDVLSHNLYDVAQVNADIYVAGETGLVFRSTDGGNSFVEVTSPVDATLFCVTPTGDGGVFVCGVAGQAFRSADAGKTWQPVKFDTQSNLTSARLLKSGAIVVVGEDGDMYVSFDHARSFSRVPEAQPMALYDFAEAANGDIVLVGNGGTLTAPARDFQNIPDGD